MSWEDDDFDSRIFEFMWVYCYFIYGTLSQQICTLYIVAGVRFVASRKYKQAYKKVGKTNCKEEVMSTQCHPTSFVHDFPDNYT